MSFQQGVVHKWRQAVFDNFIKYCCHKTLDTPQGSDVIYGWPQELSYYLRRELKEKPEEHGLSDVLTDNFYFMKNNVESS